MDRRQKKIEEIVKKLLLEDYDTVIQTVLEHIKWPVGVKTDVEYFVNEDDTDGARRGIGVHFLSNGDGVISLKECVIESHFSQSDVFSTSPHIYRFRNWVGGGKSLYVHNALLILAHAVIIDKDEEVIIPSIIDESEEHFITPCSPDCEDCLNDNHEYKKLIHELSLMHFSKSKDPAVLCNASFKDFDVNDPNYLSYSKKQSLVFEIAKKHKLSWISNVFVS